MFDIVIRNGTVVDGSGAAARPADVAISGGQIAAVGTLDGAQAAQEIDARGMVVAPGFIDMHTHSDTTLLVDGRGWSKLRQGVTTEVVGNCGITPYPVSTDADRARRLGESMFYGDVLNISWTDLAGYRDAVHRSGISINVAPLVGHSAIRGAVVGFDDRRATEDENRAMQRLLTETLEQGAFGLSVGLTLPPSAYGNTEEVVALARAMAAFPGRIYSSHSRGDTQVPDASGVLGGMAEALEVGRRAGVPVQLSHMAVNDPGRWGTADRVVAEVERVARDQDVRCDVYPYHASSSGFSQCLPSWAQSGGRLETVARLRDSQTRDVIRTEMLERGLISGWPWHWDRLMISRLVDESLREYEGMNFAQAGERLGMAPVDAALHLMAADEGRMEIVFFYRTEEDMRVFLRHPLIMVGSDGFALTADGPTGAGRPHPRSYGAHARVLGRYVRDERVLSMEEAVYKMTGQVAARLGMKDRGLLRPGQAADMVVFDPQRVIDRAEFVSPHRYAEGVSHVLVNGTLAVDGGEPTGARAGRALVAGAS